jgi:Mg-chelatase subunit ChlD
MRNLPFKRHLVCLVIGSQLLGCSAGAASIAPQPDGWAPTAPPASQPTATRPNFYAPTATNCARPLRTREVPGNANQVDKVDDGAWPAADGALSKTKERRGDAAPERLSDTASSGGRAESEYRKDASMTEPALAPATRSAAPAAPAMAAKNWAEEKAVASSSGRVGGAMVQRQNTLAPVTAGVVDDNANFGDYLAFRNRTQVAHRPVDVAERYLLQVRDKAGRTVPDAEVRVQAPSGSAMWARTDAGGQVWVSPNAFDASHASTYQVSVRKPGHWGNAQATGFLQRGQKSAVEVTLDATPQQRAQLDLVFLIDATGSMADEIDKLKATVRTIANDVAQLPAKPDLCFGLVAYRDKGDAFLIRSHDFTNDLGAFQGALNRLQAGGGGDYPEAMGEALQDTVHSLSWRGNGTTRMVFLIADAPPHLDYGGPQYDEGMVAALGKGIKIFSVGASGLDKQGEYIQRQMAQYTGGKFVFLTYDQASNPSSGPGRETMHDVQNYGVDTLDRLIVRLVREDLAKLNKG